MGSNIALFNPNVSVAFGSITASYTLLTTFAHAIRLIHFINDTDGIMMISTDGVTDMVVVIGDSFSLYDLTSDQDANESFRLANNTQIYIRYITAPTMGNFYINAVYGKGE